MKGNIGKAKTYNGNITWLLEAFKTVDKEFSPNFSNIRLSPDSREGKEFQFYECIIFNDREEDALFVQVKV
jgi:hypothetical protein